jgi:hypothetical protein
MDAIILNDGRELWTIYWDFRITNYVDEYCLATRGNKVEKGAILVTEKCQYASSGKWIIFKNHLAVDYVISSV